MYCKLLILFRNEKVVGSSPTRGSVAADPETGRLPSFSMTIQVFCIENVTELKIICIFANRSNCQRQYRRYFLCLSWGSDFSV